MFGLLLPLVALVILFLPVLSFIRSIRLERQLDDMRRRLDQLERRAGAADPLNVARPVTPPVVAPPAVGPSNVSPPIVSPPPVAVPPPVVTSPLPGRSPAAPVAAAPLGEAHLDLEERIGGRWLQHAGLVVLLLGVAFFLRYAFEHDWLSPTIRVGLGLLGGLAMVAGGMRLAARYRNYGLLLSGGGVAVLYLSVYAGFNLYALFGAQIAFTLLVAVTIAAAALADRTNSQAIAIVAVCGGFATPFLVGGRGDQQVRLFSYVALLIAATMYLAHRRSWRWLNVVSLAFTCVVVLSWASVYYADDKYLRTELFLTLYCAMFVDILRRSRATAASAYVGALLVAPLGYHLWSVVTLAPHGLAFLVYLIAFTALAVMLSVREASTLIRAAAFVAMALPLGAWTDANQWRGWVLTSCAAIVGIYAMHLLAQLRAATTEQEFDEREVFLIHANGVGLYVALYQVLVDTLSIAQLAALGVLLAAVNAGIWLLLRRAALMRALHWLGVAFTLIAAAVWLQFGGPWAVVVWATEGAVVLWIALQSGSRWLRIGGWLLLALAALRWAQGDIQQTTTSYTLLFNARALTGGYLVALLYFAAWKSAHLERAVLTVAASVVTLIVLSTEIVSFWTLRSDSADALVAREMMLSASWVAYAAVLVAFGIRRKYAPIRYFAITLFGVALAKVFFVDLETLGGIYRVAGFLLVGLILLVVSFLYQRNTAAKITSQR